MNLSGIVVTTRPESLDTCRQKIEALAGMEVHQTDPERGVLVVVQEAPTVGAEVDGLRAIKAIPEVRYAEMVYHYFAEDDTLHDPLPDDLDAATGMPRNDVCVPAYLNE